MDPSGFLEFIKDDRLHSLCNPYGTRRCEYFSEDECIRKINKCNQALNIIYFNIRSLPKHSGEHLVFLEALEIHFYIIVLSEIGARNIGTVEHLLSNYDLCNVLPKDINIPPPQRKNSTFLTDLEDTSSKINSKHNYIRRHEYRLDQI